MKRAVVCLWTLLLYCGFFAAAAAACDSCASTMSKMCEIANKTDQQNKWFFDFTFEQQNWDVKDAAQAHRLHHEGHHFHDKTHEEFYHYSLGVGLTDRWCLMADLPYVVRGSLDIEHHATLGRKQQSEGIGDLQLLGVYKIFVRQRDFFGVSGGVKFATGGTKELDPYGVLFEPELQPGSGSTDYPVGLVFQKVWEPITWNGQASYVIKTRGSQAYEFSDLFFASLKADCLVNPESRSFETRFGVDMTFHNSGKDLSGGIKVHDSGDTLLLLGPAVNIKVNEQLTLFGNFQLPIYQSTGGVHQKLDYVWTSGAKVSW